jgi:DivIVA domain-containing protein
MNINALARLAPPGATVTVVTTSGATHGPSTVEAVPSQGAADPVVPYDRHTPRSPVSMSLTPQETQRDFKERFRGYDPDEVDEHLARLADRMVSLQQERDQLIERLRDAERALGAISVGGVLIDAEHIESIAIA